MILTQNRLKQLIEKYQVPNEVLVMGCKTSQEEWKRIIEGESIGTAALWNQIILYFEKKGEVFESTVFPNETCCQECQSDLQEFGPQENCFLILMDTEKEERKIVFYQLALANEQSYRTKPAEQCYKLSLQTAHGLLQNERTGSENHGTCE